MKRKKNGRKHTRTATKERSSRLLEIWNLNELNGKGRRENMKEKKIQAAVQTAAKYEEGKKNKDNNADSLCIYF